MKLEVPEVLKREHQELHLRLESMTPLPGELGAAARNLAALMHAHLRREEQFAFPLLSLLPHLTKGTVGEEMAIAIPVVERFRSDIDRLKADHVAIVAAIEALAEAARREKQCDRLAHASELLDNVRL